MSPLRRIHVLLTGFGPFPGMEQNISGDLVRRLADHINHGDTRTTCRAEVLDTVWERAPARTAQLIAEFSPDVALHFGVASSASGFQIETRATTECQIKEDADGNLPAPHRLAEAPRSMVISAASTLTSTLPADQILSRLRADGYPAAPSDDAGSYLCNAVMYQSLRSVQHLSKASRAGFIHIPHDARVFPGGLDGLVRGSYSIVNVCIDDLKSGRTTTPPLG